MAPNKYNSAIFTHPMKILIKSVELFELFYYVPVRYVGYLDIMLSATISLNLFAFATSSSHAIQLIVVHALGIWILCRHALILFSKIRQMVNFDSFDRIIIKSAVPNLGYAYPGVREKL